MEQDQPSGIPPRSIAQPRLTRRDLIRATAVTGAGVGAALVLSSCAGAASSAPSTATGAVPVGSPRRGGELRVGVTGAGELESMNPAGTVSALINVAMVSAVFESLTGVDAELQATPVLATSWKASPDAKTWTFTLREGVTWHDGSPFTADDVIYSLLWTANPDNGLAPAVAGVDLDGLQAPSPNTVVIPLVQPNLLFPVTLGRVYIVKKDATEFAEPVGTGPFVFESLVAGQQGTFTRNASYWDGGKPYVDTLTVKSLADDTARMNALAAGEIDMMAQVPYALAQTVSAQGLTLLNTPSLGSQAFYMAVDEPPFDDVRVRQAIRLLADRDQLVQVALGGYGEAGNDLFGKGMEFYAEDLPQRVRDVAAAKQLLADAGYGTGLEVTLQTSAVVPGMVEAATLFAQQAAEGGVTVTIEQVDPAAYFDPTVKYLKMPFGQTYWAGFSTLEGFYTSALLDGAPGNETHWVDPSTTAAIQDGVTAVDAGAAEAAWLKVQRQQYDEGGYLWWGIVNNVDATSPRVAGVVPNPVYPLGLPDSLSEAYFSS